MQKYTLWRNNGCKYLLSQETVETRTLVCLKTDSNICTNLKCVWRVDDAERKSIILIDAKFPLPKPVNSELQAVDNERSYQSQPRDELAQCTQKMGFWTAPVIPLHV
jgi:hypothetical protein